jgi:hypothetical protein
MQGDFIFFWDSDVVVESSSLVTLFEIHEKEKATWLHLILERFLLIQQIWWIRNGMSGYQRLYVTTPALPKGLF